jgi:hypothetical protein
VRRRAAASTPWSACVLPEPLPKLARALARRLPATSYNADMNAKRPMLALAAVLAATVITGGAAIAGLAHRPAPQAAPVAVVQQHAPAPAQSWDEGGD